MWYDENPKKTAAEKIQEAVAAYVARFNMRPSVVLVNIADYSEVAGIIVRSERTVGIHNFWVGLEENPPLAPV